METDYDKYNDLPALHRCFEANLREIEKILLFNVNLRKSMTKLGHVCDKCKKHTVFDMPKLYSKIPKSTIYNDGISLMESVYSEENPEARGYKWDSATKKYRKVFEDK